MDSIAEMHRWSVAQEGAGGVLAVMIATSVIGAALNGVAKKQEAARRAKREAEELRKKEDHLKSIAESAQRDYGITLQVHQPGEFANKAAVLQSVRRDVTNWLNRIVHSSSTTKLVNEVCQKCKTDQDYREDLLDWDDPILEHIERINPKFFLDQLGVSEGVNGWDESIQFCDGSQGICVMFGGIGFALADMLQYSYSPTYLIHTGAGDGDEGHVYYELVEF